VSKGRPARKWLATTLVRTYGRVAVDAETQTGRLQVLRGIPGVRMVAGYQPRWLPKDLMAGLVLTAILVPQGMAYAELAGLPPITGLYTSILCLVGYAALGPSRILVLGPDSSLGPMIAATILPLVGANGSPARAVALASMLAILVGATMILAGVAKLGFVADLLSKPTQIGYMTGLALTILVGQLPKLFGFSVHSDTLIGDVTGFVDGVRSGKTVTAAVIVGLFGLVVIVVLQRWIPKVPGVLVAVVVSIGAAVVFDLASHGVSLVGTLPQGLPPFTIPSVSASDFGLLVAGALGISLVALTDTISTASAFAARSGDEVQANQEMIGIGTSNVAAGLFQGFPVSTSGSRTAVAAQSGAKTQVTGLVGAAVIVLMLLVVPGLFRNLPQPTLAAVVMAAALSLADLAGMKRLWEVRRTEFALSIAAFLGVAVLGVLPGIAIAVGLSILNVFRRSWWPYSTNLGRVEGVPGYHDVRSYPDAERIEGLIVFRFDAPLFFANARAFRQQVRDLAVDQPPPRWIVVAAEPITDVDTTAADMLEDLDESLNEQGISLVFAEMKDPVRAKIERYELTRTIDPRHFFPTIGSALAAFDRLSQGGTDIPLGEVNDRDGQHG
jgi:high affinity sulfate transporter 1